MTATNSSPEAIPLSGGFSLISVAFTLFVNAIPLLGVILLGWSALDVLALYWLESAVLGLFHFLKMATSAGSPAGLMLNNQAVLENNWRVRSFFAIFFCLHYGFFIAVQGVLMGASMGDYGSGLWNFRHILSAHWAASCSTS